MLRSLAYVTGSVPRGSIGSPLEWGAEAYVVWSRHVSAPDPCLALIKAWVFFVSESWDPAVSVPDPTQRGPVCTRGGPGPCPEVRSAYVGVRHFPMGVQTHCRHLGGYHLLCHVAAPEPSTWWGQSLFTTRLEIAARAPHLHTVVRGTPVLGYRHRATLLGRKRRRYPSLDAFADLAAPTEAKRLAVSTLRPTRCKTKAYDEVAPSRGLIQREGPRRIRPIVTGPARLSALRARLVTAFSVMTVCNPALWEYSGDDLGA
jgi:hypothetical protein